MEIYDEVTKLLNTTTIPLTRRKNISSTSVRSMTLGLIHKQFTKYRGLSKATEQHPDLYNALLRLATAINPDHIFSTITINKNVVCSKHKDSKNNGTTLIVGIGSYEGGELVTIDNDIETVHDIKYKPMYFNGYLTEHYNLPFTGDRWSLMFYSYRGAWNIVHRPQDIPIIKEVYHGNGYHKKDIGFGIEQGDLWIDIGAHIGCFSKKAINYGASVNSYEPTMTFDILKQNVPVECCFNFAVCSDKYNESTVQMNIHELSYFNKIKADETNGLTVQVRKFKDVLKPGCCVKMDIEGSEMDILDNDQFNDIKKMVIAYHINVDPSVSNLVRRVDKLRQYFRVVWHQPVSGTVMKFFPNELFIYCMN